MESVNWFVFVLITEIRWLTSYSAERESDSGFTHALSNDIDWFAFFPLSLIRSPRQLGQLIRFLSANTKENWFVLTWLTDSCFLLLVNKNQENVNWFVFHTTKPKLIHFLLLQRKQKLQTDSCLFCSFSVFFCWFAHRTSSANWFVIRLLETQNIVSYSAIPCFCR